MVKIKLAVHGSRNRKTYRMVVMEEGKRRDGKAIENVGFYNPLVTPPQLSYKQDRIDYWISVGAQMTDGVRKLIGKA